MPGSRSDGAEQTCDADDEHDGDDDADRRDEPRPVVRHRRNRCDREEEQKPRALSDRLGQGGPVAKLRIKHVEADDTVDVRTDESDKQPQRSAARQRRIRAGSKRSTSEHQQSGRATGQYEPSSVRLHQMVADHRRRGCTKGDEPGGPFPAQESSHDAEEGQAGEQEHVSKEPRCRSAYVELQPMS